MSSGLSMANVNKIKQMAERHEYNLAVDILDSQNLERSLNPQFLRSCAEIYENVGRLKEARQLYVKAHSMAPVANRIIFSIMNFYLKRGFKGLAERYFEEYEANVTGLSGEFSEGSYIMKKAARAELNVLHDMLYPGFRDQLDENWSFELFLILYLMDKKEEYEILSSDYLATFKDGYYTQTIVDILDGRAKAETYFYIYPKDESKDNDPEEESIRAQEEEVLKADYLRRNPQSQDAVITEMYDDVKTGSKFLNKIKKNKDASGEPELDADGNVIESEGGNAEGDVQLNAAVEKRLKSFIRKRFLKGKAQGKKDADAQTEETATAEQTSEAAAAGTIETAAGQTSATEAVAVTEGTDTITGAAQTADADVNASTAAEEGVSAEAKKEDAVADKEESGTESTGAAGFVKGFFNNIRPTGTTKADMKEIKPEKEFISYDFDDGFAPESESIYDLDKEEEEAFENPFDSISAYKELERYKQNAELDFRKTKESSVSEEEEEKTSYGSVETETDEDIVLESEETAAAYQDKEEFTPEAEFTPGAEEEYFAEVEEDEDDFDYDDYDYSDIDEEYISVTKQYIASLSDSELASMTDEELAAAIDKVLNPQISDRSKFDNLDEPFYEVASESEESEETVEETAEEFETESYETETEAVEKPVEESYETESYETETESAEESAEEFFKSESGETAELENTDEFEAEFENAEEVEEEEEEPALSSGFDYASLFGQELESQLSDTSDVDNELDDNTVDEAEEESAFAAEMDSVPSFEAYEEPEISSESEVESEVVAEYESDHESEIVSEVESKFESEQESEPESEEEPEKEVDPEEEFIFGAKIDSPEFSTINGFDPELEFTQKLQAVLNSSKKEPEKKPEPTPEPEPEKEPEVKTTIKYGLKSSYGSGSSSVFGPGTQSQSVFGPGLQGAFGSDTRHDNESKIAFNPTPKTEPETFDTEPVSGFETKPEPEFDTKVGDEFEAEFETESEVSEAVEEESDIVVEPEAEDIIEPEVEPEVVYEGEPEPAYLMVKPRFEFPEFKTDLFPTVRNDFNIENKFDDIVSEKQTELDAKLKAEDEKMREAQELLASLGIDI